MSESSTPRQEGFWFSRHEPHLPYPVGQPTPPPTESADLAALAQVEGAIEAQVLGKAMHYRGSSSCRCCGGHNGSLSWRAEGWEWPEGLGHYVEAHHVALSEPFRAFLYEMMLRPEVAAVPPRPRRAVIPIPSQVTPPPTLEAQQAFQAKRAELEAKPPQSLGQRLQDRGLVPLFKNFRPGPRPPGPRV